MATANFISFIGLFVLIGLAFLASQNRKIVDFKMIIAGVVMQLVLAVLIIGVPAWNFKGPLRFIFDAANTFVISIIKFTEAGTKFVFGDLASQEKFGLIFAVQILPIIIFMSSLMAVLYHVRVLPLIVDGFAKLMKWFMRISGAESLSTAANVFLGQTEAPIVIRPFIEKMTKSELYCVMVGGMANTAGTVLGAYTVLLQSKIPDIAGHLLTCSVLSAPATIVIAKIIMPETEEPETYGHVPEEYKNVKLDANIIDAVARGASEGMFLVVNVAAMLIAFMAVIAMVDAGFAWLGDLVHFSSWGASLVPAKLLAEGEAAKLSLSLIFGWFFAPLAWVMGIPWADAHLSGVLLGQKVVLNEFVAYLNLAKVMGDMDSRSVVILSYALCGFANFLSIGIQIGGIGAMAPSRKKDLARLGILSIIGGSLATFMTATIAGMLM